MNSKLNIAILAGGNSSEANISLKGALQVARWLNPELYNAHIVELNGRKMVLKHSTLGDLPVSWDTFSTNIDGDEVRFDCALILIHGTPGENGLLQGYLEMMDIPYTTGDVLNSAITFNKGVAKHMLQGINIHLAKDIVVRKGQQVNPKDVVSQLGLPLFVKPNQSGSSYGITKVKTEGEISQAIESAFTEDTEVMLEGFIPGMELTCGVVKTQNKTLVLPVTEIVPKNEFFDYGAKYENQVEEITPARIPDELTDYIQTVSSEIYDRLNCRGIVRIDYIYTKNKLYFLEVNTVPGMSEASIVPQQVEAMGLTMSDIFQMVIEDALNR